jgi:TonB family protein
MTEAWKQYEGQIVDGKFDLRTYLGGGDRSAVFVTHRGGQSPQDAAIKIFSADPQTAELLLSRWKQSSRLSHPHLLGIFEMGRCQLGNTGFAYIVTEFADDDVSRILPERKLTAGETLGTLEPVLEGLAYLHDKGFVHGHLKPTNIMAIQDQVKLSIDGVRRIGDAGAGPRHPSAYDPPEATAGRISPASDVWSLGMTLVELLTQHLPTWERMGEKEPKIPESVPEPFLEIARNCLRRDPQSRWTVQDIAAHLQPGSPVPVTPRVSSAPTAHSKPPIARQHEHSSKSKYLAVAIAVVVALAVVLGIAKFSKHSAPARPESEIASQPAPVQPAPEAAPEKAEAINPATKDNESKPAAAEAASPPPSPQSEMAEKPAGEIVRSEVLHQVVPDVPQQASNTISGTVKVNVRISVDPSGNVAEASLDLPGPSKYFANLALQAARQWTFTPAKANGQGVSSEWVLRFEFTRAGAKVFPAQSLPR